MKNIDNYIKEFRERLNQLKDGERAVQEKRYLKSPDDFYGVSIYKITVIVKDFRKKNPTLEKTL